MSKRSRPSELAPSPPPRSWRRDLAWGGAAAAVVFAGAFVFRQLQEANRASRDLLGAGASTPAEAASRGQTAEPPAGPAPAGMVWIPGGEFTMGTDDPEFWAAEHPAHRVSVDGFWMDATEVTNEQFAKFVDATGYVTTAERPPRWEDLQTQLPPGTPQPPAERMVAASVVFVPPSEPVPLDAGSGTPWWEWTPGACWKHPEGPASDLTGREKHPVVHVSWDDAQAYAQWAGKRLPTEAQWERAARGGVDGRRYVWGDAPLDEQHPQASVWQGAFPHQNTATDGYLRTAPAGNFTPNAYGLYDMAGNVWEWCSDWYRPDAYLLEMQTAPGGVPHNPPGPAQSYDPQEPYAPKRVHRGGSFLCHFTYCLNYRPSSRRGTTPDTSMSHLGFRCVQDPADAVR